MSIEEKRSLEVMLKRIAGQVGGISKMINEDKDCDGIMTQIVAAMSSLRSVGRTILVDATSVCSKEESAKLLKRFL
jgi:DNA-binding FrmR family transcriptional regulator